MSGHQRLRTESTSKAVRVFCVWTASLAAIDACCPCLCRLRQDHHVRRTLGGHTRYTNKHLLIASLTDYLSVDALTPSAHPPQYLSCLCRRALRVGWLRPPQGQRLLPLVALAGPSPRLRWMRHDTDTARYRAERGFHVQENPTPTQHKRSDQQHLNLGGGEGNKLRRRALGKHKISNPRGQSGVHPPPPEITQYRASTSVQTWKGQTSRSTLQPAPCPTGVCSVLWCKSVLCQLPVSCCLSRVNTAVSRMRPRSRPRTLSLEYITANTATTTAVATI